MTPEPRRSGLPVRTVCEFGAVTTTDAARANALRL